MVKNGVTSFYPTIITNSDTNIISLLKNIASCCDKNSYIDSFIGGVHLEGPFISKENEARGAHDIKYVKDSDWELFEKFQEASGGRIKIVTISPEGNNILSFIKKCVKNNVIVSLGHTNVSPDKIKEAVDAGAKMSTHLGNGVALRLTRTSNIIFEQLADERLTSCFIADGFHLSDSFLKVALKAKQNSTVLVSDSTMFGGMKSGVYNSHIGNEVVLEENGRLSMKDNKDLLAGASLSILDGVNNLIKKNITSLSQAWSLASVNPNNLIGNSMANEENMVNSDFVLFEICDNKISIVNVFKKGKQIC
jgi:N-acetylglucosamine-6-phosphate deacetylase